MQEMQQYKGRARPMHHTGPSLANI
jgi:hypothetical protein